MRGLGPRHAGEPKWSPDGVVGASFMSSGGVFPFLRFAETSTSASSVAWTFVTEMSRVSQQE